MQSSLVFGRKSLQNLISGKKVPFKNVVTPFKYEKQEESFFFDDDFKMKPVSHSLSKSKHKNRPLTHTIRIRAPEKLSASQVPMRPISQTSTADSKLTQSLPDGIISTLGKSHGNYAPTITRETMLIQQLYEIKQKTKHLKRSISAQQTLRRRQHLVDNPFFDSRILDEIGAKAHENMFEKKFNIYIYSDKEDSSDIEPQLTKRSSSLLQQFHDRLDRQISYESECISENDSEWYMRRFTENAGLLDLLDRNNLHKQHSIDAMILRKSYKTNEALIGLHRQKLKREMTQSKNMHIDSVVEQKINEFQTGLVVALATVSSMRASIIKCHNSPIRSNSYLPYKIVDSAVAKHQTPVTAKTQFSQEDIFNLSNPGLPILGKFIQKPKTASSVVVQQLSAMSSPKVSLPAIQTPRASNKSKGPGHLFLTQDFYSDSEQLRRQKLAIRNLEFKSGQALDQVLTSRRRLSLYID